MRTASARTWPTSSARMFGSFNRSCRRRISSSSGPTISARSSGKRSLPALRPLAAGSSAIPSAGAGILASRAGDLELPVQPQGKLAQHRGQGTAIGLAMTKFLESPFEQRRNFLLLAADLVIEMLGLFQNAAAKLVMGARGLVIKVPDFR